MKNLDKIQALNAITTLKNSKANEEQKAAAITLLSAPKESFKNALEKTDAGQSIKDAYVRDIDAKFEKWLGELNSNNAMDLYKELNTVYAEFNAKLQKITVKILAGSLPTAASSTAVKRILAKHNKEGFGISQTQSIKPSSALAAIQEKPKESRIKGREPS